MNYSEPYRDRFIALATMHAKERAIAKPFKRQLGAEIVVAGGIDTDTFGTFTGEVPRRGTLLEAAKAKARAAIDATRLPLGLGSEGSFGPHPSLPFVAGGIETIVFADHERDFAIHETLVTHRTNFGSRTCKPEDTIEPFLQQIGFPAHAVVVRPNEAVSGDVIKGVRTWDALQVAIRRAAHRSNDGLALIVTDMRAHLNPTRMSTIRALSNRLAKRIANRCPACRTPGFGMADIVRGLPCRLCSEPTSLAMAEIHRCAKCNYDRTILTEQHKTADPGQCTRCNP
jgi:hypothetical protein